MKEFLQNNNGKLSIGRLGIALALLSGVGLVVIGAIGFFQNNPMTLGIFGIAGGFFGVAGGVKAAQGGQ